MLEELSAYITDAIVALQPAGVLGLFAATLMLAALFILLFCRGAYGTAARHLRRLCRTEKTGAAADRTLMCAFNALPADLTEAAAKGKAAVLYLLESRFRAALFSRAAGGVLLLCGALSPVLFVTLYALSGLAAAVCAAAVLLFFAGGILLSALVRLILTVNFKLAKQRGEGVTALHARLSIFEKAIAETAGAQAESGFPEAAPVTVAEEGNFTPDPVLRYTPYVFEGYDCPHEDVIDRLGDIPASELPMHEMQAIAALLREQRYKPENKTPLRKRTLDEAYKRLLDAVRDAAID